MINYTRYAPKRFAKAALCSALTLAFVAGCSSTAQPIAEMAAAKTAMLAAEGENTQLHAPVAMDRARQKMRRAEVAMAQEDYATARRLAEEAQADAELAQAISSTSGVQTAVKELEDSIEMLREEITRARSR